MSAPDASRVHIVVASVPAGSVASYGQVAELAGLPGKARWVGRVLSQLPSASSLPWHRIVNSQGVITCPNASEAAERLRAEGVDISNGRVNMRRHRWSPGA